MFGSGVCLLSNWYATHAYAFKNTKTKKKSVPHPAPFAAITTSSPTTWCDFMLLLLLLLLFLVCHKCRLNWVFTYLWTPNIFKFVCMHVCMYAYFHSRILQLHAAVWKGQNFCWGKNTCTCGFQIKMRKIKQQQQLCYCNSISPLQPHYAHPILVVANLQTQSHTYPHTYVCIYITCISAKLLNKRFK